MAPEALAVWLHGSHVATVERRRGGLRLGYSEAARRRWELGNPLISLSLPIVLRPYRGRVVERFFDGLLPEGQLRRTLAHDFRVPETDTFGLLREIGRDCAGALVIQPETEDAPSSTSSAAEPINDEDVAERIANLALFPLGVDERVRVSLAGMQNKLLLVRTGRGWALPTGSPSTHILKPTINQFPGSVENEAFCMQLARRVGLRAARADVQYFGGKPVLVVERFDRIAPADSPVRRVHQEDVTQALGIASSTKYESSGGPSLRRVAKLLSRWRAPADDLEELLRMTTFVVAVGDADHHAKNISVLHHEDGSIRLAPLYDVMSTRSYPAVTVAPGMFVNAKRDIDNVRFEDLVSEGVSWGMRRDRAQEVVGSVLSALPEAIETLATESRWAAAAPVGLLRKRVGHLAAEATHPSVPVATPPSKVTFTRDAVPTRSTNRVWVHPYRRDDGTPVRGHWRELR